MAEIVLKAPWVGPKMSYFFATPPGETTTIPDAWLAEIPPGTIVITDTSPAHEPARPPPGTLLREVDWLRQATEEEKAEIVRLRQPDPDAPAPVVRRRANVIAGTNV